MITPGNVWSCTDYRKKYFLIRVLRGMMLEIRDSQPIHHVHIEEAVLASSNSFVDLIRDLELLRLKPPNGSMLLRRATFTFSNFSDGMPSCRPPAI
jgi:hypothetical protein